ncbi:UNVERIFIED_CONTAM: hypothetical protein Sindi_3096300 [Sesamum indicum]
MDRTIWGRSNDAMVRTIQGGNNHVVFAKDVRANYEECPAIGKVADFVSNSNHIGRRRLVLTWSVNNDDINIDLVNNVVNVDMDNYRGKETCVEVVKGDLVSNDEINIDLVNAAVHVDMDNEEDSVDTIKDGNSGGFRVRRTYETNSTYSGFIGNIPLQTSSDPVVDDKIADAFNNSSRKTLSFGTIQNDEIVVRPTIESIQNGARRWESTAVGYFLGKQPYFYHVQKFALSAWPGLREVKATSNGFYFFQFKTIAYMEEAIEGGPWLFHGQSIVLQKWEPGMAMRKLKHTQVPVWIRLRHLPVELWTVEGLSTVASGIGRPLYPDAITRACTRLDFACVCLMLDVSSKLPKHIIIMMPKEEGGEITCKIDIEYEWLPPKCTSCMTLGHTTKVCAFTKPSNPAKPPVSVYVPKTIPVRPPPMQLTQGMDKQREGRELPHGEDQERIPPTQGMDNQRKGREHELPTQEEDNQREGRERPHERRLSREEKGKEIAMYNTFDALQLLDDAEDTPRDHIPRQETEIHTLHHVLTSFGRRAISDDLNTRNEHLPP